MYTIYYPRCVWKAWKNPFCYKNINLSPDAYQRLQGLLVWNESRAHCSAKHALKLVIRAFGHTPSYWYRWKELFDTYGAPGLECQSTRPVNVRKKNWDSRVVHRIKVLRNHEDTCCWGGRKLRLQLLKEGLPAPSAATIDRIIAHLKRTKQIYPLHSTNKAKKRAHHTRTHAIRYTITVHGTMSRIPIDVDEYWFLGIKWYHFSAIHVATRYVWAQAYSRPRSQNAMLFLRHILATMPQGLTFDAIQVDGGSWVQETL